MTKLSGPGAGRQAALKAAICFGLCASERGRKGICLHFSLWQQARIGIQPDVASGRYVQLRLCPTRLRSGHHKIMRSNAKATSDLHSKADQQIMQSHDNTAKAHIGAESSSARSSIAKRALQQAKALRRSEITHFRWSPAFGCLVHPMQASSRWDLTRGDHCSRLHARATDFHFTNRVLVSFF